MPRFSAVFLCLILAPNSVVCMRSLRDIEETENIVQHRQYYDSSKRGYMAQLDNFPYKCLNINSAGENDTWIVVVLSQKERVDFISFDIEYKKEGEFEGNYTLILMENFTAQKAMKAIKTACVCGQIRLTVANPMGFYGSTMICKISHKHSFVGLHINRGINLKLCQFAAFTVKRKKSIAIMSRPEENGSKRTPCFFLYSICFFVPYFITLF